MFITVCQLTLHDFLFYASREMGRLYETEKHLHNFGLTYALGIAKAPYSSHSQEPHYQEELESANEQGIYVTPARPLEHGFAFHTFKRADPNYYNLMEQNSKNFAVFGRAKELTPNSRFEFFVLSKQTIKLPRWIRLGKWMSKASLEIKGAGPAQLGRSTQIYRASGALNPLDIPDVPVSCNLISMAPASLITNASFIGDHYTFSYDTYTAKHPICLPVGMRYQADWSARKAV